MSLGVKGPDVAALVMNGAPNTSDWSVPRIILRTIFSYWDIQINPKEFVLHALNFFITYYKLLEDREQKIEKHFLYNFKLSLQLLFSAAALFVIFKRWLSCFIV